MNQGAAELSIPRPTARPAEPHPTPLPPHQPVLPGFFTEWQMEPPSGAHPKTA